MSETRKKVLLDAALREWPDAEKSSMEWEERARSVVESVRAEDAAGRNDASAGEDLLTAPLGQSLEDGHNSASPPALVGGDPVLRADARAPREGERMTMPVDRERDRRSLQDLAKLAQTGMTPPPPSVSQPSGVQRAADKKDDSGIVDLAAAAASDPQGAERAQSTPLASAGLFDDEPQSVRPGPVSAPISQAPTSQVAQPVPTIPPAPASIAPAPLSVGSAAPASAPAAIAPVAAASTPAMATEKKGGGKVVAVVFGLVALAAAAAGTFVVMNGHKAATASNEAKATAPEAKPVAAPPATQTVAMNDTPATTPSEPGTDLNALPTATPNDTKSAKIAPKATGKGTAVAAAPAAAKPAAPEAPKEDPKLAAKDVPTAPTGPAGALGDEMRKAVGASDAPTPAAGPAGGGGPAAGSVPQKPSQGAITGALGAVLPEARRCLGPDDPISRASVVFGSNGTVQTVNVSGAAAGKPAEACIKGALMKAKVAPFAEATYSAPVTIRH